MLRLLLTLLCGLATAAALLGLRQTRLELQHECNAVHDEMLHVQAELWRQQVQIAAATAPAALEMALANGTLRVAPDDAPTPWDSILPPAGGASDGQHDGQPVIAGQTLPARAATTGAALDWDLLDD